jgi:plastocyanin
MSKKIGFFLAIAAIMLMANSCSSPTANNQPVAPAANPNPGSLPISQEPAPVSNPTPNNSAATTAPASTNQTNPADTAVPPPAPIATPAPITPPAATRVQVNIQNFSFNPSEVTVGVGSTVVWTNNDSVPHQIASNLFNSSPLSQGNTFSYKFTAAGTYDYHCAIHPSMTGKIIVK